MTDDTKPRRKIGRHPALGAPYTPPKNLMLLAYGPLIAAYRVWYDADVGAIKRDPVSWEEFWIGDNRD